METIEQECPGTTEQVLIGSALDTFAGQLQKTVQNSSWLAKWSSSALPALHQKLSANQQYLKYLDLAKNESLLRYSGSTLLFESPVMKASLVAIDKGRALPMHDHPGASGLMLVIDGSVDVCHCNLELKHLGQPRYLDVVQMNNLEKGQVSWFTDTERNIHSVDAVSQRAVLLVIHMPSFSKQQSFYFPLKKNIHEGVKLPVQRINAHVLKNITQNNTGPHKSNKRHTH